MVVLDVARSDSYRLLVHSRTVEVHQGLSYGLHVNLRCNTDIVLGCPFFGLFLRVLYMERKFVHILKSLFPRPLRSWAKMIGPGELFFTRIATISMIGENKISAMIEPIISIRRLISLFIVFVNSTLRILIAQESVRSSVYGLVEIKL